MQTNGGTCPLAISPSVSGRIGVLLLNLGTPDGTGYWPMRRYLKEFLSDERVIEEPRWKWWPILNLIILTVRPGRKGRDYATIWNNEKNESPMKTIYRNQAERLAERLQGEKGDRRRLGHALRQPDDREPNSRAERAGLRSNSARCRSIRNTRRRRRRPPAIMPSER